MTTLVLHRGHIADLHMLMKSFYGAAKAVVLVSKEKLSPVCFSAIKEVSALVQQLMVVEEYDKSSTVEALIYELSQVVTINHVFACAEFDLYRAERIKQWLGLDFVTESKLRIFRNKIAMKDHFAAQGIKTSTYAFVKSVLDIYDFAKKQGYPLVLKQQEGGGGVGTKLLYNEAHIKEVAATSFRVNGYTEPALMVESYVKGALYHVDGVVFNREILYVSCGEYINGLIQDFEKGGSLGSIFIPESAQRHKLLAEINQQVINAADLSIFFGFHAEYFVDGNEVTLCEIACRTGGAGINEANRLIRAVDINAWLLNTLYLQQPQTISPQNMQLSGGWVVSTMGHEHRKVEKIAKRCDLPFVESYRPTVKAGQWLNPAVSNIQGLCGAIFAGKTPQEAAANYQEFAVWLQQQVEFSYPA